MPNQIEKKWTVRELIELLQSLSEEQKDFAVKIEVLGRSTIDAVCIKVDTKERYVAVCPGFKS